jgi:acyl-CoA synthetase (AMP-forming)/AMP-acid ligase II
MPSGPVAATSGVMHPDGHLAFKDRRKDTIISVGRTSRRSRSKVCSTAIRRSSRPPLSRGRTIDGGETPRALVTLKPGANVAEDIIDFSRQPRAFARRHATSSSARCPQLG